MTAIIPFGQKVALRVGKVLYRSKSSFRYKVHFLKLIHFRKSNKESIKLNQFEDMTQVVDGFSNFFKKVFKSSTFSSKDFFYSGKILVYFAPKLSNQNYWISKPMPKSSCQTGEERLKTFALSFKNVNEFYSKKATFSLFVKKPGAAIMWEIPNRFSECYRHKTNLSL